MKQHQIVGPLARQAALAAVEGNYGHGIDTAWLGIDNVEIVAVANEDEKGRTAAAARLKTKNAYRTVDIHSSVVGILAQFVKGKSGLLFPTGTGRPEDQSNVRNRLRYPLLERLGIEQRGFHAFRSFRVTHLR